MSATVTYKGNTLTTVNNETKILETAGTWLEDDITIEDATQAIGTDTSDTTATPADVMIGKSFYDANGDKVYGTVIPEAGNAFYVTYSQDSHGGTVTQITGVDISDSTISSSSVLDGHVGYDATGHRIVGAAQGGVITQDANGALIFSEDGGGEDKASFGSITGVDVDYPPISITIGNTTAAWQLEAPKGDVVFNFPYAEVNLCRLFQGTPAPSSGPVKFTLNCRKVPATGSGVVMNVLFYNGAAIKEIEFNTLESPYVSLGTSCFQGSTCVVETIGGNTPISLKTQTSGSYRMFQGNTHIKDVLFYENYSATTIDFGQCSAFTDNTLISIANALQVPASTATLTLHATPKARLSTITGFVGSVTRDEETYDKFVADANGNVTLQDFITNIKGWTIA